MQDFIKPIDDVQQFWCDNGGERESASRKMGWRMPTFTPGVPQTNGLAERCVRKVKEGGAFGVVQGGFKGKWWWKYSANHCIVRRTLPLLTVIRHTTGGTNTGTSQAKAFLSDHELTSYLLPKRSGKVSTKRRWKGCWLDTISFLEVYGPATISQPNWSPYSTTSMKHLTHKARFEYTV